MPDTIEGDGRGVHFGPQSSGARRSHARTALSPLRDRWQGLSSAPSYVVWSVAATILFWAASAVTWVLLCLHIDRTDTGLGWDLVTTWRAERVFAHGGQPYSRAATDHRLFLYPPSALLLFRPLSVLSLRQAQVLGLIATAVVMWAAVMVCSALLGRRWWGLTSAVVIFALRWTEPLKAELGLENVTVVCTLGLVIFYLLAKKGHWVPAAAVIGLTMSMKPLLLPVLLVFVLARKWRALVVALAVPAVLNAAAFAVVKNPSSVFSKLPSLLNRSGSGVFLNSAWVDVLRTFGVPDLVAILVRLATVVLVIIAAWWSWQMLDDLTLKIITTSSVLLIGTYLAGTLSENHFMLTLVPLAMTVIVAGAPMRWVSGWIGVLLLMGLTPPASWLGINTSANLSAFRAFGMTLVLLTVIAALGHRRWAQRRLPDGADGGVESRIAGVHSAGRRTELEDVMAP